MFNWFINLFKSKAIPSNVDVAPWRVLYGNAHYGSDPISDIFKQMSTLELYTFLKFNSVVSSCVSYIIKNLTVAPLIATINDEEVDAPQLDLLKNNPDYTLSELFRMLVSSYFITGAGYCLKFRNKRQLALLTYVPTTELSPIMNRKLSPLFTGYKYEVFNGEKVFDVKDVLAFRHADPSAPHFNLPVVYPAMRDLQLDEKRIQFWIEMLQYCPIPGLVISSPNAVPPQVMKDTLDQIENAAGLGRRGGTVFLPNDIKAEVTKAFGDNFDWSYFNVNIEARICAVLGVPPQLVSLESGLRHSTYSNYEEARKAFFQNTMRPLWVNFADALTHSLCQDEGDTGLKLVFDISNIPELNEYNDEVELFKAGILTKNEVRIRLGYPELKEEEAETTTDNIEEDDEMEENNG